MNEIDSKAWRLEIKYGPEGEANYAFVFDASGALVSNLKIHHAHAVVDAMNRASKLAALEDENKTLREAVDSIKARVCGDAFPNWDRTEQTTRSRLWIADTCDAALSKPAALPAEGKGNE